jgi:16S rRNA (adenine1518-N6/adenine1519-N6)-dimethyltransferase
MKLTEMRDTLREIQVSPVKSLGQNFLHDRNIARWIVDKAELTPDDYVVEIGPGLGALTEFLLESGATVLAIEKDRRLAEFLRKRFPTERLEVLHADALDFDLRPLFGKRRVKLLGNLPYYIASQLVMKFTKPPSPISLWLCMLQNEMARRICAAPGTKDYGALTLSIQICYRVEYLRTVPANLFLPQPDVDSAFVRISPRPADELPMHDSEALIRLVRRGFSQRRKQLRNLLSNDIQDWDAAALAAGFEPRARGEELALEQWITLSNLAHPNAAAHRDSTASERFALVDEQDRVIGDASRAEVHGNNLRHRAVHILVFDQSNQVFLQKRSRWKDRHPGLWDSSAAGHVDAGEEYDAAACRELAEELGVTAELTRVTKLGASEQTGQEFIWLYQARHDGPFRLERSEIEHGEFFPTDVVAQWLEARPEDFAPGFVECWRAFRKANPIL